MLQLKVIHASTREGRKGIGISKWIEQEAKKYPEFEVELVDLKELNLPFFDEPEHPRFGRYHHQHTKGWSAVVDAADAFIFVTPEYNHGMPATLKNALDYLSNEWHHKPVAMVGYGGISAGTRAIQQLKQVTSALKMTAFDGMLLAMPFQQISPEGNFGPTAENVAVAKTMFQELQRLGQGLKTLRPEALSMA